MGVDTAGLKKGFASARKDLNAFAGNVATLGLQIGAIGAVTGLALGKVVVAAANVQEQADYVRDTFGAMSGKVIEFSNAMATGFGIAKKDSLKATADFASIFEGAGYASGAVADLSVHMVKLGLDIARQRNITSEIGLEKLKSGLAGQAKAVRELGVAMLDSDVKSYALAHGIKAVDGELSSAQKIAVRSAILTERFAKAQDNLAKTGDKVAGAIEGVKGRFENLSATIGDSLLLIAAPLLGDLQVGLQALQTSWVGVGQSALGSSGITLEGITAQHGAIGTFQAVIGHIADAWQVVSLSFKGMQVVVVGGLAAIGNAVFTVVDTFASLQSIVTGKKFQPAAGLKAFTDSLNDSTKQQIDEFKVLNAAPFASEGVNKAFEQGRKDIQAARDKLAKAGHLTSKDILTLKQTDTAAGLTGKEHKGFAGAEAFGSKEAASTVLRSRFGMGGQGPAEKTAANTAKTNVLLERLVSHFGAAGANQLVQLF